MRLRDYSDAIPKPMVPVGYRPILWNIMKYYAHYGHKDFILCLGYKADVIKNYFMNYDEYVSNDFVIKGGGSDIQLLNSDIHDWTITFVDTGIKANIGQRLMAVKPYLEGEEVFMANYADGLTNMPLPQMVDHFSEQKDAVASFMAYYSSESYHVVKLEDESSVVQGISPIGESGLWINCGYFLLRQSIFDYIEAGDELVDQPFKRLINEKKLSAFRYNGFWSSMDTFKDKQKLDDLQATGLPPWEVWKAKEYEQPAKDLSLI